MQLFIYKHKRQNKFVIGTKDKLFNYDFGIISSYSIKIFDSEEDAIKYSVMNNITELHKLSDFTLFIRRECLYEFDSNNIKEVVDNFRNYIKNEKPELLL